MSKGTYIGLANNLSVRIKKLFLGTSDNPKRIKRAYLGIGNNEAPLVYADVDYINFTSNPFSNNYQDWTNSGHLNTYSTNTYGTWRIQNNVPTDSGYDYAIAGLYITGAHFYCDEGYGGRDKDITSILYLPNNIAIKPTTIVVSRDTSGYFINGSFKLQGYTKDGDWVNLASTYSPYNTTITYTGDYYFTRFKLTYRSSSTYGEGWRDCQFTSGIIEDSRPYV